MLIEMLGHMCSSIKELSNMKISGKFSIMEITTRRKRISSAATDLAFEGWLVFEVIIQHDK